MIKTRLSAGSNTLQRTFSGSNVTSSVSTSPKSKGKDTGINASFLPSASTGGPVSTSYFGGPGYSTLLQGIVPDKNPMAMIPYYRDCYYTDGIAGATVDMSSTFPFSDFSLTGLQSGELDVYNDSLSRLNMRSLMSEISAAYLVDGAFIGTLVFDPASRSFQDVLVHDTANAQISMQPLHSLDPVIKVNSANALNQFLGSDSPYIDSMLSSYPKSIIETYLEGNVALDPLSTLFVPRRGLQDSTHTSYLHRVMPSYLFEKVMYRGTLIEAHKRQRSTTHIKMGDENWIPSDEEIAMTLGEFQRTEMDPLGAWIATRQGIDISEVRSPSDSFKWTEIVDTMVPIKLRALGISEAFLSGDACLAGDTLIATSNGLVRIDSAFSSRIRNKVHNLGWIVKSRYKNARTKGWIYNGFRETLTIDTEAGNQITATGNHPVLVLDNGQTQWKRTDEINSGDILCISTDKLTRKTTLALNLAPYVPTERELNHRSYTTTATPTHMTPKLARALAYIISEGYTSPNQFSFTNTDKKLVAELADTLKEYFNLDLNVYEKSVAKMKSQINNSKTFTPTKDVFSIKTTAKSFLHTLKQLGLVMLQGRTNGLTPSYFKQVPWSILQADEESQIAFIAGYAECDGSIRDRICWVSKSSTLLRELQAMLNAMGYAPKLWKSGEYLELNKEESVNFWTIASKYVFSKNLNTDTPTKYSKLDGVPADFWINIVQNARLGSTRHGAEFMSSNGDIVVWSENAKPFGFSISELKRFNYSYFNSGVYDNFLELLSLIDESAYTGLKSIMKLGYRYTEVISVTASGKEHVYDLSMIGEPAFVANGLIVHNSYSTAESAVNSFTDSMLSFRQFLTYKIFQSRIFPLIAVLHNLYKDKNKSFSGDASIGTIYKNLGNINNLKLPTIQWHKSLEGKDSESQFDMLERLSEKGFVIPLRMWASSAGLDMSALMRDLAEDAQLKAEMEKMTGKRAETIGNEDKKGFDDNAFLAEGESEEAGGAPPEGELGAALLARKKFLASKLRPSSVSTRVPILARDMTHLDLPRNARLSKSGKNLHANVGDHRQDRIANDKIIKAIRALKDPEHAKKVRDSRLQARASGVRLIPGGMV